MFQRIITAVALLVSAGCGSYDLSVNERVVYTPLPLFSEYTLADEALRNCVSTEIERLKITQASQLRDLDCSDLGVESVAGLGIFTSVARLVLSDNRISDPTELGKLSLLRDLQLANNKIVDPRGLYQLPALQSLDLRGNGSLTCPGNSALLQLDELKLPGHCPRR
ncbi:leucine-rich repeat domain-containing protein [Halioglobus maricola]|uniref:leucine-rich repeat domain-containing protein n=1 Tax=Halioglobus maricola TaxID=2601894 RepID=UPI001478F504|nr:leucine-rich repeat domain-containing protein [Halioglobus maricola]